MALDTMSAVKGRYIYAIDRKIEAEGRQASIIAKAVAAGEKPPFIEIIFSDADNNAGKPVIQLIEETARRMDRMTHYVIIITHAGLKMTDYSTYQPKRWNLIVDEVPDIFEIQSMDTGPLMVPFFEANYDIDTDGTIGLVRPIPAKEFKRPCLSEFRQFHDLVKRGNAKASVTSWNETAESKWYVSRSWDVELLNLFESTTFFADSFTETVAYHVMKDAGVQFEEFFLSDHRVWTNRVVTIYHYDTDHEASAYRFKSAEMRSEIAKIAAHMSTLGINNHLWTTNASIAPLFDADKIGGECVKPRQAGSNKWVEWHDASMIYAARPSPDEILVHAKRGMSEDDLIRARGGYDIKQFVMRLSLRDPASSAPVSVRLYDKQQAIELKAYLDTTYGFSCKIVQLDVSLKKPIPERAKKPVQTAEERRVARAIANKTYHAKLKVKRAEQGMRLA